MPWRAVCCVNVVRLIRRVHRLAALRPRPVVLWPERVPPSCVVAFFHSSWDLVIARELREGKSCLVRTGPNWVEELGVQHVSWDFRGLRSLVRQVTAGAVCAVAADNFAATEGNGFLGTRAELNPAAVRLAAVTGRPLVTMWPFYRRGVLRIDLGEPIAAAVCAQRPREALLEARRFFEHAVRRDVAGWSRIGPFLEREFGRRQGSYRAEMLEKKAGQSMNEVPESTRSSRSPIKIAPTS